MSGITLDQVILDASTSSIAISDGTDTLAINGDGSINATISATDLDIRDLSQATDSVSVFQATHDNLNLNANLQVGDADVANGNPVPISDAGASITVDAVDFDIRDLTHASDSVKVGDGTDFLAINADGSINTSVAGTSTINTEAATVTTTAAEVLASPLAGRRFVTIQNKGSQSVFILDSAGTAKTDGIEVPKNASATYEFGENVNIFLVADSGSQDVRLLEIA